MIILTKKIMYCILSSGKIDDFLNMARANGAKGGSILFGKGSVNNVILKALGFSSTKREIVVMNAEKKVCTDILEESKRSGKFKGIAIILGDEMESGFDMISIIVSAGYSDDIMDAARKAGAGGGTIMMARGTARAEDLDNFLGIKIANEKEMIYIVTPKDKTGDVVSTVSNLECLQQKGIGVLFVQSVESFAQLGN